MRAVLDTTAIRAYGHGSIHVGELLGEFADEGALFGLPVVCLAEAYGPVAGRQRGLLNVLVDLKHAVVLPVGETQWRRVGAAAALLGGVARACAALPVVDLRASYVVTAEPQVYGDGIGTIGV